MKINKLIKSPYEIRINGQVLSDVNSILYKDKKLYISFYPTYYKQANYLLDGLPIEEITMSGCTRDSRDSVPMIVYYLKDKYSVSLDVQNTSIIIMNLEIDVRKVRIKYEGADD